MAKYLNADILDGRKSVIFHAVTRLMLLHSDGECNLPDTYRSMLMAKIENILELAATPAI